MGNVAASGGYYAACGANWIVAQPLTVTGSIGVVFMRWTLEELFQRMKVSRMILKRGENAGVFIDLSPLNTHAREVIEQFISESYQLFLARVQKGRGIPEEELEKIAGGRVWYGKQALALGLIDQLGSLSDAVKKAAELAGLPSAATRAWAHGRPSLKLPPAFPQADPAGRAAWDYLQRFQPGAWMFASYLLDDLM